MDSRLLNVFHDDPFDGNYGKFDNDGDFWSSSSETMGLQLTETLQGILPIAPTEDASVLYNGAILKDDYALDCKDDAVAALQTRNALIFDDFSEHHVVGNGGSIEIVTVDPNEMSSDDDDSDDSENGVDLDLDQIDNRSQNSYSTFRTRTDSSSIGDYESHSSDYDDDDDDGNDAPHSYNGDFMYDDAVVKDEFMDMPEMPLDVAETADFKLPLDSTGTTSKNRTFSTNTIGSDADGLGLHIDASTFDLADFITKDDFTVATKQATKDFTASADLSAGRCSSVQVISSKNVDSDAESDIIVDVETVEFDVESEKHLWLEEQKPFELSEETPIDSLAYEDNVKKDPSWSPVTTNIKKEKEVAPKEVKSTLKVTPSSATPQQQQQNQHQPQHNFPRIFSLVPSKRQCDILKGKHAPGRGKNISMQRSNGKLKSNEIKKEDSKVETKKQIAMSKLEATAARKMMGMGQGGKNLALIKHERESISEQSSEDCGTPTKSPTVEQNLPSNNNNEIEPKLKAVKRKLNLEEYKQRRGQSTASKSIDNNNKLPRVEKESNQHQMKDNNHTMIPKPNPNAAAAPPAKHSEAVTTIVKNLKGQTPQKAVLDPITEAKNKVLRMQELKKAQLLKIIDSTVSAKVPRVTKVLPLKDMVKDSYCSGADENANTSTQKTLPDYEEIVIVSASCNTDISIPPMNVLPNCQLDTRVLKHANIASRSLLKSSALLYNISNSFQKVQATENVKLSTNSLIASIQDVVVKKTSPIVEQCQKVQTGDRNSNNNAASVIIEKNAINSEQHGEDKIIMHLRKDRIRKRTFSISVQTDILPEFPLLPMPKGVLERKSRDRKRRRTRGRYSVRHSDSSANTLSGDESSCSDGSRASYRSRSRSAAGDSCTSSSERLRRSDTAGGYSSRSSRHHRSSISSSSESERNQTRRSRKSNYKQHSKKYSRSSSNSSSEYSGRSRSRSPLHRRGSRSRSPSSSSKRRNGSSFVDRNVSQPAVEERRIVYVGRIEQETNKEMLRRKFIAYGPIKQISIHYKETGMKYGFVTYERSQDAFTVIDGSARDPLINMYDISFGGRRAFCRASYADLDNAGINTYQSYVYPQSAPAPKEDDSFEALLQKVKAKMNASKSSTNTNTAPNKI